MEDFDLIGKKFNKLTVIKRVIKDKNGKKIPRKYFLCK